MDAMAEEGRGTDSVMAHLTDGEIVIPLTIAHNKRAVQHIAMMFELAGEDIEEFIVGSPKQKINPETGHPEFLSLKSAWKAVTQPISTAIDVGKDVIKTTVNVTKDVINTGVNVTKDVIALDPKAAINDTVGGLKDVGSDVVSGTKQAIKDTYTGATKTLAYAMDAVGILPNVPKVNAPTSGGQTSGATVTQGDQVQRNQSVTDVQAAAGGGASSLTPRTVAGPDNDYKLNKSAVLGL